MIEFLGRNEVATPERLANRFAFGVLPMISRHLLMPEGQALAGVNDNDVLVPVPFAVYGFSAEEVCPVPFDLTVVGNGHTAKP